MLPCGLLQRLVVSFTQFSSSQTEGLLLVFSWLELYLLCLWLREFASVVSNLLNQRNVSTIMAND